MGSKFLKHCRIVTYGQWKKSWTTIKIKDWVEAAGGVHHMEVQDDTTHLVITQSAWKTKGPLVQTVLKSNELQSKIKIVTFDWLEDSLLNKSKKREGPYICKMHVDTIDLDAGEEDDGTSGHGGSERKTGNGLMREVFDNSTAHYLDRKDTKRLEKQRAAEERIQVEKEETQRSLQMQQRLSIQEQTALFKQGAIRGQKEAFSDFYHVYVDQTGFPYDIILTKADVLSNTNQRLCLTIFESNVYPPSYAVNANLKQSHQCDTNDVLVALGSNWHTAFNAFKRTFEEKTGLKWQDPSLLSSKSDHAHNSAPFIDGNYGASRTSDVGYGWLYQARHYILPNGSPKATDLFPTNQMDRLEQANPGGSTLPGKQPPEPVDLEDLTKSNEDYPTHNLDIKSTHELDIIESNVAIAKQPLEWEPNVSIDPEIQRNISHEPGLEIGQHTRGASCPYESLTLGNSLLGKRKMTSVSGMPPQKMVRVASEPIQ